MKLMRYLVPTLTLGIRVVSILKNLIPLSFLSRIVLIPLLFIVSGFGMVGYADSTNAHAQGSDIASDSFLYQVKKINIGMSRERVFELLGPYTGSLTPPDFQQICHSYRYKNEDEILWIQIWYDSEDRVETILTGRKIGCWIS